MKQSHLDLLTLFLSELIATGLLVLMGCMGCVDGFEHHKPTLLTVCLTFGFAVMVLVNIFGMVSGAHMNPAVTVAALVYKLLPVSTGIVYIVAQLLGGYLGYGLLRVATPDRFFRDDSFCVSLPSSEVSTPQAFIVEFIISAILILVCCAVFDPRTQAHHDSLPLRFGMTITVLAFIGAPYSGGSMNPARSFGPALYNWNFTSHWIYWVAPMSAGLLVSTAFKMIFWKEAPKQISELEEFPLRKNTKSNGIDSDA